MRILAPLVLAAHLVDVGSPVSTNPVQDSATHVGVIANLEKTVQVAEPDRPSPSQAEIARFTYLRACQTFRDLVAEKIVATRGTGGEASAFVQARTTIARASDCLALQIVPWSLPDYVPNRVRACLRYNEIRYYLMAVLRSAQLEEGADVETVIGDECRYLRNRLAIVVRNDSCD